MSCRACPDPAHRVGLCVDCLHAVGAALGMLPAAALIGKQNPTNALALVGMPRGPGGKGVDDDLPEPGGKRRAGAVAERRQELERAREMLTFNTRSRLFLEPRLRNAQAEEASTRAARDASNRAARDTFEQLAALNRRGGATPAALAQANEAHRVAVERAEQAKQKNDAAAAEVAQLQLEIAAARRAEEQTQQKIRELEAVPPATVRKILLERIDERLELLTRTEAVLLELKANVVGVPLVTMSPAARARAAVIFGNLRRLVDHIDDADTNDPVQLGNTAEEKATWEQIFTIWRIDPEFLNDYHLAAERVFGVTAAATPDYAAEAEFHREFGNVELLNQRIALTRDRIAKLQAVRKTLAPRGGGGGGAKRGKATADNKTLLLAGIDTRVALLQQMITLLRHDEYPPGVELDRRVMRARVRAQSQRIDKLIKEIGTAYMREQAPDQTPTGAAYNQWITIRAIWNYSTRELERFQEILNLMTTRERVFTDEKQAAFADADRAAHEATEWIRKLTAERARAAAMPEEGAPAAASSSAAAAPASLDDQAKNLLATIDRRVALLERAIVLLRHETLPEAKAMAAGGEARGKAHEWMKFIDDLVDEMETTEESERPTWEWADVRRIWNYEPDDLMAFQRALREGTAEYSGANGRHTIEMGMVAAEEAAHEAEERLRLLRLARERVLTPSLSLSSYAAAAPPRRTA